MTSKGASDTQTQSNAVATGNTNFVAASGNLGSSSLSGFGGPWYIETQTLEIEYVRVPSEQYWNNTCNATLSGLSTTHGNIQSTKLVYNYKATYDATVSYQTFNSSSVQQPQAFTVVAASGDPNGISYGTVSGTILGPMGSIITNQPFIRRVPYTGASSQPLVSKVSTGSNFAIYNVSANNGSGASYDGLDYFTDLNYWSQLAWSNIEPIGNASQRIEKAKQFANFYTIPGAYDTSKELYPLDGFIDGVGFYIANESHYKWPISDLAAPDYAGNRFPEQNEGLSEYDINRHA